MPERTDVLRLPGIRKVANGVYTARRLRVPSGDVREVRATLLEGAVSAFRPAVLVADKHPLGVGGELRPALAALRAGGGRAVLGLRDILDDPPTVRDEWRKHELAQRVVESYERVLVYGVEALFDPVREYGFPDELARITRYCGYVLRPDAQATVRASRNGRGPRPVVLATAGGGEDGFELMQTFLVAASRAAWDAVVVSGRQAGRAEHETLSELARRTGAKFRTFVPSLASTFDRVDALVCMGGYNTLVEAVATGLPTVCVPRVEPRSEQLMRASLFARLGLVRLLEPSRLDPETLRAEVSSALESPRAALARRAQTSLNLDGAHEAACQLLELASVAQASREPALATR